MRPRYAASLILACAAGIGCAMPAQAQGSRMERLQMQPHLQTARGACAGSFADARCATYQRQVIKAVAVAAASSAKPVSLHEFGNRQLDALIATIN